MFGVGRGEVSLTGNGALLRAYGAILEGGPGNCDALSELCALGEPLMDEERGAIHAGGLIAGGVPLAELLLFWPFWAILKE